MSTRSLPLPSQSYLHERFDYDEAGFLIWKFVDNDTRCGRTWNSRFVGKRAGCLMQTGYVLLALEGQRYLAERLIWVWHNKLDPGIMVVDHRDRVRHHNWIDNLRLGTSSQNARNKLGHSKLGLPKGVKASRGKYNALIMVGQYSSPEEAGQAVVSASDKMSEASDSLAVLMQIREQERRGVGSKTGLPRGVEYLRERQLWRGYLSLGWFNTPEEASMVYTQAALVLFGEFARI